MLHLALYQPAIAPNVGNAARQCVGLNARLHVIGPTPLSFDDQQVKRAGLDYWPDLQFTEHGSPEDFLNWLGDRRPWLITKFGQNRYDEPNYEDEDVLVLGNENRGLPQDWHDRWPDRKVYIPILGPIRSYNLSNAAFCVLTQASMKSGKFEATKLSEQKVNV